jgi:hypothetical protein
MKQPTLDIQRELDLLAENTPTEVAIPHTKKVYKIGWIKNKTVRKITQVLNSKAKDPKEEDLVLCKAMALIVLNDYWKILFFYPILWRWFAYVRQYNDYQILPVIEAAKKKAPQIPYYLSMIYLTGLKDSLATMTREEVERTHREQS